MFGANDPDLVVASTAPVAVAQGEFDDTIWEGFDPDVAIAAWNARRNA
jgi:F420-0:gamma-glutamyl ligase-like protein